MRTHTSSFKDKIKLFGRQLDSIITYELNGVETELGMNELNSVTPHYEGSILKSVMKQLDIDSNVEIPVGTIINYQFGVKTRNEVVQDYRDNYDYIDFGNYIVKEVEKQEDTYSYKITCYDKMLYSMIDYKKMEITYPITIREYINTICNYLGLAFANINDTFANYDREIQNELYLDAEGNSLGYTFRDILDELAQVTASTICINNNDALEIRYITNTASKNLLNKSEGFEKGYINNSGTFVSEDVTCLFSDYIPVTSGETYTFSTNVQTRNKGVIYYDSSKNFVSRPATQNNIVSRTDTIPSGVAYIRLQFSYDGQTTITQTLIDSLNVQFEKGNIATEYESYGLDTIDEEYLKDINVNFGEKYGKVNSIVLSRSAESDNVYLRDESSVTTNGLCELKIIDNQIMNGNDRSDYLEDILEQLDGFEYYINDFTSTGITYYELCDRYNIKIDNNTYSCVMLNDEVIVTQGLEENIHTDLLETSETEYDKADKTDRRINQTYLIVNKQKGQIESLITQQNETTEQMSQVIQTVSNIQNVFQITGGNNLIKDSQGLLGDDVWIKQDGGDYLLGYDANLIGKTASTGRLGIKDGKLTSKSNNIDGLVIGMRYSLSYKVSNNANTTTKVKLTGNSVVVDETYTTEMNFVEKSFNFVADTSTYTLEIESSTTMDGYGYIYDLMLNKGDVQSWEPASGEIVGTVLKMSQMGLQINCTGSDIATLMTSQGFQIKRYSNGTLYEVITEFTNTGLKTKKAETTELLINSFEWKQIRYQGNDTLILYKKESD